MSVIVCDASPLIALAFLGHLDILRDEFGQIFVPPTVAREVATPRLNFSGFNLRGEKWVTIRQPASAHAIATKFKRLDQGEAEAISLALEMKATLVIIDEVAGRSAAFELGFNVTGTIGLLLQSKSQGLIPTVKPPLDRLRSELHFFVSNALYKATLAKANE